MTETLSANIYDYPRYYDLVFGSDWKPEMDFLKACFELHARRQVTRVFEPACGTGRLLYRLAREGYDVAGLDLNAAAVEYCNDRFARYDLPRAAFVADMTDFRLSPKADASFNTINSFRHLQGEAASKAHLGCMADALRKGGLYLLGLHLTPTRGTPCEEESWSARRGHLAVNTHMKLTSRNRRKREEVYSMTFDIWTPTETIRLEDEIVFRTYTAKQMAALIESVPQLEVAAVYDFAYDVSQPIEIRPETEDVVYVLRKK